MNSVTVGGANSADFTVGAGSCGSTTPNLAGRSSCDLAVTFAPQALGARAATLSLDAATGSGGSTQIEVALSGMGISVPGAPAIGAAMAGMGQALVSFSAPASDGGTPIAGYTVTATPGGLTASSDSSPIIVTGLGNGTAYTFTVTATNGVGTGPASAPSNSVTPSLPTYTVTAQGPDGAQAVSVGGSHSAALKNDGTVVAWGWNAYGQTTVPAGLTGVTAIAAATSGSHTVALKNDGTVVAWGYNDAGQTVVPPGLGSVTAIAAGALHTVAVKGDGTVEAWGSNVSGQTSVPPGLTGVIAAVAGAGHTVVLKNDGTVTAWGSNVNGQTAVPSGLYGVIAIAAGNEHTVALTSAGTLVAWGLNTFGQADVPSGLSGVVAIAAGDYHTVALKNDGTVVAWGANVSGQTTIPPGLSGVVAVAAGGANTAVLKDDGTVMAWGYNGDGQTAVPAGLSGVLANGDISCASPVTYDASSVCMINPTSGYHLNSLTVNGIDRLNGVSGNSLTIDAIRANQRVVGTFALNTVPDASTEVTATAGIGEATITFTPPASDGGSPIIGYTVTSIPAGGVDSNAGTMATSHVITGLSNGMVYTFTVTATNEVGTGPASEASNSVAPIQTYTVATHEVATAIAAGTLHSVALQSAGSVIAWGDNSSGQINVPLGLAGVRAISAGNGHTLAVRNDGTVIAWGENGIGQANVPTELNSVTAIAAGGYHSVALKNDGTVVAWGRNDEGQITIPPGLSGVAAVAAGVHHTVALQSNGTVVAWGDNRYGQTTVPVGLSGVMAIAAGEAHTAALKNDGTVVVWGANWDGQTTVPTGLSGVKAIAAGWNHMVALQSDGTVLAWGRNSQGQTDVPAVLSGVRSIAAGAMDTLAIKGDGTVVAWGVASAPLDTYPNFGQANVPIEFTNTIINGAIACDSPVVSGEDSLCTITPDSGYHLASFTVNGADQLANVIGDNYTITNVQADQVVSGSFAPDITVPDAPTIGTATAGNGEATITFTPPASDGGSQIVGYTVTSDPGGIQASSDASPILVRGLTNGTAYTFIVTATNGVGTGPASAPSNSVTPVLPPSYTIDAQVSNGGVIAIAAGVYHTVALKGNGTVVAWGDNGYGQTTIPSGLTGVTAIAAGGLHDVALKNDGTVVAWGDNSSGQTSIPSGLSGVIAIAAGAGHTVALKSDGTVVAWGDNSSGQTTIPVGLSGVTAIAAGGEHTVALKSDGTVVAWGDNMYGQTTIPSGLSGVTAIAVGYNHTVALKSDGTVVAWGWNQYGQTMIPSGLSGVTAIAAGAYNTVVLNNDSSVVAWGNNWYGQTDIPRIIHEGIGDGTIVCDSPVLGGSDVLCTITPAPGCLLASFTVNGVDQLANVTNNSYTIANVQADQVVVGAFAATAPDAPTIGTATAGNGKAMVSFTPPAVDGGSPIHSYTVTANPGGFSASGAASPLTVFGLTNDTVYTFTVTATNVMGTGPASAPSNSVTPTSRTIPLAEAVNNPAWAITTGGNAAWYGQTPVNHDGQAAARSGPMAETPSQQQSWMETTSTCPGTLNFWWKVSSEQDFDALRFTVDGAEQGSAPRISGEQEWTQVSGVAIPAGNHSLRWSYTKDESVSEGSDSGWVDQVVLTKSPVAPGPPLIGQAIAGVGQATVSFSPPVPDGCSGPIVGYTVVANPGGMSASSDSSPITVTGLANGTSYTFTVTAINDAGPGPASATSNPVTPFTVPDAPVIGLATAGDGRATVAFSPPAFDGGSPVTGYTVTANPGGMTASGTTAPLTVTGLANGTTYTFTAIASNVAGAGPASLASNSVTPMRDGDGDGVVDSNDNCPEVANGDQADADGDGVGDLCDPLPANGTEWQDTDGDGVGDNQDNCVRADNADQTDTDQDARGDACDRAPVTANYSSVVDAPHNETRGITCQECHSYALWWQYSPAVNSTTPTYAEITNAVCAKCHTQVTHAGATSGGFSVRCVECHSAHDQAQLGWRGSVNLDDLYLKRGTIDGSFVVNGGLTTFAYTLDAGSAAANPEWSDPATWGRKSSTLPPSGLILVVDTANATDSYAVIGATATTITVKGGIDPIKAGKTFGLIYGRLIKKGITTPTEGVREVKFLNPKKPGGGYTDSNTPATGICQVCHTSTASWTSNGGNTAHHNGENCTDCHRMAQGFKP